MASPGDRRIETQIKKRNKASKREAETMKDGDESEVKMKKSGRLF